MNIIRKNKDIIIMAILLFFVVAIAFQINSFTRKERKKVDSIRIGVAAYKVNDTFISTILSDLMECAKAYEQENNIKIRVDVSDGKEDQIIQNAQIDKYIALDYDVICVNMVDRTMAAAIIDKAESANIPIVFFNREPVEEDMLRWDQMYYVGADARESGVLQGEIVVDEYRKDKTSIDRNGDGTVAYVILEGESGHQDSLIRTEWSVQTLKNDGMKVEKLTGAMADWDRNQAKVLMEKWLKEYGDQIELIISNNDDMALGAIDAIEMLDMERIAIVGIDGIPQALTSLEEEKLLGTVVSDSKLHAQAIFDIAYSLAKNQEIKEANLIQGKYIRVKQYKLTKENNVNKTR